MILRIPLMVPIWSTIKWYLFDTSKKDKFTPLKMVPFRHRVPIQSHMVLRSWVKTQDYMGLQKTLLDGLESVGQTAILCQTAPACYFCLICKLCDQKVNKTETTRWNDSFFCTASKI